MSKKTPLKIAAITVSVAFWTAASADDFTKTKHFDLCKLVRKGNSDALQELVRRNIFDPVEVSYIASGKLYIGMSEGAAACASGPPQKINSTNTARGKSLQIVLGNGRYIYIENGRVTAWQD